jgi:DNA-binding XRE family transcriptional regulator
VEALLCQEQLALSSGVSRECITRIECGRGNPSILTLHLLARALGCQFFHLLPPPTLKAIDGEGAACEKSHSVTHNDALSYSFLYETKSIEKEHG